MTFIKVQPIFRCKICNSDPVLEGPTYETDDDLYSCEIYCPKCVDRGFLSTSPYKGYVVSGTIQYWNYMQL
jgi:hypothetical protein